MRNEGIQMPTKIHDEMIELAVGWAKSLGYAVVECHLGTATGADAVLENQFGEIVILEVVTGASFKGLFEKPRIKEELLRGEEYDEKPELLGLIVVGDRIDHVKDHGVEVGLPAELFDPPEQTIFPVLARDFKQIIPVLLVSLLGARASAYGRLS